MKALRQARGGILFIDEAHGLCPGPAHRQVSYSAEAVESLVGHLTEEEFKGNLLVIMAGYTAQVDQMFACANPGLRSRFDKLRISFPAWTGVQAYAAAVASIEEDGKRLTEEAHKELQKSFQEISQLASWASARDVFETILPAMYAKRATRIAAQARTQHHDADELASTEKNTSFQTTAAYTADDVKAAFANLLESSAQAAHQGSHASTEQSTYPVFQGSGPGTPQNEIADKFLRPKAKRYKKHTRRVTFDSDSESGDEAAADEAGIWAALELVSL